MRIVLAGAGKIGQHLARLLIKDGNHVIIIDKDEEVCKNVASDLDALVIAGDATKMDTLRDAEVGNVDVLVAVTDRDEVNLLACMIAKEHRIPRVIARVGDPGLIEIFQHMGVEKAISPEIEAANVIHGLIRGRFGLVELITTSAGDLELVEVSVNEASPAMNKKLKDLKLPVDCPIIAHYSGGKPLPPKGDSVLRNGDRIVILVRAPSKEYVNKAFAL